MEIDCSFYIFILLVGSKEDFTNVRMLRLTSLADYSRIPQLIFKKSLNVQKSPILIYRTLYQNPLRKGCKCGRTLPDKFPRSLIFNKRTLLVRFASQHASKAANIKNQSQEIKRLLALARPEKWKIGGNVLFCLSAQKCILI